MKKSTKKRLADLEDRLEPRKKVVVIYANEGEEEEARTRYFSEHPEDLKAELLVILVRFVKSNRV